MTAPELHARLTAARAAIADFRRWTAGGPVLGDWQSWALRLAAELDLVGDGLWGALSMLEAGDELLEADYRTGLRTDGGLSVAPDDTEAVLAAIRAAGPEYSDLAERLVRPT